MTERLFELIVLFIIFGTPFCGAQDCTFKQKEAAYVCEKIVYKFPNVYYGNYRLRCAECQIQIFDAETFPFENTLRSFNVSNSGLETIEEKAFSNLNYLEFLYLQNNNIKHISPKAFDKISQLYELHLEFNALEKLEAGFVAGLSSNLINLSNNKLENISSDAFKDSILVLSLDLSHNQIKQLSRNALTGLNDMEELDLSHNRLCHISLGAFRNLNALRRLNLSDNKLTMLNSGSFTGLKNLIFLSLGKNFLENFDAAVLLPMMHLTKLDVSSNGITAFDINDIVMNVPTIRVVTFEDNIFSCTLLKNAIQFLKAKLIEIENNISRDDYLNINGIACIEGYIIDTSNSISLQYFLKKSKQEADILEWHC